MEFRFSNPKTFATMKLIRLLLCAVFLVPALVKGQSIVQSIDFGPAIPNYQSILTFDKFNGPLTDLLSVHVSYSFESQGGSLILTNLGDNPATGLATFGATFNTSSAIPLVDGSLQPIIPLETAMNMENFFLVGQLVGGPGTTTTITGDPFFMSGDAFVNSAFRSSFVGPGTYDVAVDVSQSMNYGAIGGLQATFTPVSTGGNVTVTYNIVPEPGSALLAAFAGVAFLVRRRRQ